MTTKYEQMLSELRKEDIEWLKREEKELRATKKSFLTILHLPEYLYDNHKLNDLINDNCPVFNTKWSLEPIREEFMSASLISGQIISNLVFEKEYSINGLSIILHDTSQEEHNITFSLGNVIVINVNSKSKSLFWNILMVLIWVIVFQEMVDFIESHEKLFIGDLNKLQMPDTKDKVLLSFAQMIDLLRKSDFLKTAQTIVENEKYDNSQLGLRFSGFVDFTRLERGQVSRKSLTECYEWAYQNKLTNIKTPDPYKHIRVVNELQEVAEEVNKAKELYWSKCEEIRHLLDYLEMKIQMIDA